MNTSLDDDLNNRQIEINKIDPAPLKSKEQTSQDQPIPKGINLVKNTYSNFVKNIKKLATKKSSDAQPPSEVAIGTSENAQVDSAPKTWKDKLAQAIIDKVEVKRNLTVFLCLLGLGCLLLFFSLLLIPFIITSPSKFSMCFALGCTLVLISFLFFHGTKNYVLKLFDKKRFTITILFISSILVGIIFSIGRHYIISVLCSLFQLVSLVLFILTFIPGGKKGINYIKRQATSPFVKVFMKIAQNEINNS